MQQESFELAPKPAVSVTAWLAEAWLIFKANPLNWVLWTLVVVVLYFIAETLGTIGGIISWLGLPVLTAGFLIGAKKTTQQEEVILSDLFAGFQTTQAWQIVLLQLIYMGVVVALLLIWLLLGMIFGTSFSLSSAGKIAGFLLVMGLIGFLALVVFQILTWFAVPLIVFEGQNTINALKQSIEIAKQHFASLLGISLLLGLLFILAFIPLGLGILVMFPLCFFVQYRAYLALCTSEDTATV